MLGCDIRFAVRQPAVMYGKPSTHPVRHNKYTVWTKPKNEPHDDAALAEAPSHSMEAAPARTGYGFIPDYQGLPPSKHAKALKLERIQHDFLDVRSTDDALVVSNDDRDGGERPQEP